MVLAFRTAFRSVRVCGAVNSHHETMTSFPKPLTNQSTLVKEGLHVQVDRLGLIASYGFGMFHTIRTNPFIYLGFRWGAEVV